MSSPFHSIDVALAHVAAGGIVVVADDEHRENEGDLIMAADAATPEAIAFFVRHTSGVICAALPGPRCDALELPLMVPPAENADQFRTAFTVTVDLAEGTTTGISAADRAATLRALAHPATHPQQLNRPGHIFPLRARAGGVLERPGHTEAAVDLALLAGREPAGVLSEVVLDDGRMARLPELIAFASAHALPLISIADLIAFRLAHPNHDHPSHDPLSPITPHAGALA
jgi:3,4-dihydroxy 2-butanone 4-phosphate synthase/GTP cyclohydrolase II